MARVTELVRKAAECTVCGEICSRAVSLPCCAAASCRHCALAAIKKDSSQCWTCRAEPGAGGRLAPGQLVNNAAVRAGVEGLAAERGLQAGEGSFLVFLLVREGREGREAAGGGAPGGTSTSDQHKHDRGLKRKSNEISEIKPKKAMSAADQLALEKMQTRDKEMAELKETKEAMSAVGQRSWTRNKKRRGGSNKEFPRRFQQGVAPRPITEWELITNVKMMGGGHFN
jgi:hypothetical protein